MNYTIVINSAIWGGALAYYYIDARKWFTGPKITVDIDELTEEQRQALREEGLDVKSLQETKTTGSETGSGEEGLRKGSEKITGR